MYRDAQRAYWLVHLSGVFVDGEKHRAGRLEAVCRAERLQLGREALEDALGAGPALALVRLHPSRMHPLSPELVLSPTRRQALLAGLDPAARPWTRSRSSLRRTGGRGAHPGTGRDEAQDFRTALQYP